VRHFLALRFKSAPVEITHGQNRGAKAVYFLDPDDITLELVEPAPARADRDADGRARVRRAGRTAATDRAGALWSGISRRGSA